MIKIGIETIEGEMNKTIVSGTMQGDYNTLIYELCAFFEAVENSKGDLFANALDMFISDKLKGKDEE